jgi:hypothetical protein
LQAFRTKIFLALCDDFSARTASEFCGKEEQLKLSYSLSENDQNARVSVLTGRAPVHKATINTFKSNNLPRDMVNIVTGVKMHGTAKVDFHGKLVGGG